jgi:cysteinyl-tRNA synthetase
MKIYDTLTASTIDLPERTPNETSLYVCGPTVYGYMHVGNARPAIAFDVMVRHLRAKGRKVTFVRNFTDVDDKIIDLAIKNNEPPSAVTQRFTQAYLDDTGALGCLRPDHEPKVSEFVPQIISMIETLIAKGFAYARDGDVYYTTAKMPGYGKLSKRKLEDLRAGERTAATERKDDPLDFALWKGAKPHEPEGARWASPWGEGRPGWHIECSAMAFALLGTDFDVHGGGMDLVFPHHENEIAQSEAATGCPLCKAWMHNGFIEFELGSAVFGDEIAEEVKRIRAASPELLKISKSDPVKRDELLALAAPTLAERALLAVLDLKVKYAHWFQLRRLLSRAAPEAIRLWMLGTHYRLPLGFEVKSTGDGAGTLDDVSFPTIDACERRIEYFYETVSRLRGKGADAKKDAPSKGKKEPLPLLIRRRFSMAMDDDMNTAQALACYIEAFTEANRLCDANKKITPEMHAILSVIEFMSQILGIVEKDPDQYFAGARDRIARVRKTDVTKVDALVQARLDARAAKDFAKADAVRDELTALGIEVRDGAQGSSTWRFIPGK